MTTYNTAADAANTAVRAFLTKIGEYYLGRGFNTGSGKGKKDWERIKRDVFKGRCAYCGEECSNQQIEHLVMFNRVEFGLHHPGNIVPTCKSCNNRKQNSERRYLNWVEQLEAICKKKGEEDMIMERKGRILVHIKDEEYPNLSKEEEKALKLIAERLYQSIKLEFDKSIELFRQLSEAYVNQK